MPPNRGEPAGPPRSIGEIVRTIDENAMRIDRPIYASPAHVAAQFTDARGMSHYFNFDGALLFRKPRELRLDLRHPLGEPVIQIGSNEEEFWAWVRPEVATFWWGRHRNAGRPCATPIPMRSEQLVEALGMNPLPRSSDKLAGPGRLYGEEFDRLVYLGAADEQGLRSVEREYWVERRPPYMVRLVLFRDRLGRRAMSAFLDDYRPGWPGGPLVAHKVSVFWPNPERGNEEGKLVLTVGEFRDPGRISPKAFVRPLAPEGIREVVQVDEECDRLDEMPVSRPASPPTSGPSSGEPRK